LIGADWEALMLVGPFGRGFQRDLDHPRRWQSVWEQPEVRFGRPLLNDYRNPWPRDWQR
jgi:hypothetical protein